MFEWADLWDEHCAKLERDLVALKKEDPGCATCIRYEDCDEFDERGYCSALHEIVEARGYVPCEYESYRYY